MNKGMGLLIVALALVLSGGTTRADYLVYTDRVSFEAALKSETTENFNELGPQITGYANGTVSQANGLTQPITVTGAFGYLLSGSAGPLSGFYPSYGTYLLGGIGTSPDIGMTVTIPTNTYTALGADVTTYAANGFVVLSGTTSNGEVFSAMISVPGADPNSQLGFLGVTTNSPTDYINSLTFSTIPGANVNGIVDNVSFGQAIPEPASLALFATGGLIVAAGLIRRRFRRLTV